MAPFAMVKTTVKLAAAENKQLVRFYTAWPGSIAIIGKLDC